MDFVSFVDVLKFVSIYVGIDVLGNDFLCVGVCGEI